MALIGNKVVEKDLRDHLQQAGYWGRSAEFSRLELAAVKPPGWLQVFAFEVKAKHQEADEWIQLFGVCRDDERYEQLEVILCESAEKRDEELRIFADGLITQKRKSGGSVMLVMLSIAIAAVCLVGIVILLKQVS